ncbi:hypothetical protein ACLIL3_014920 [Acinetobacter radioresistens]|uniref:hypothetical protein n=1 Tax=Acinetobacter radioresistens TaxID=40216 RepID=UPI0039847E04
MSDFEEHKIRYAYNGKPQQWQWGFKSGWDARESEVQELQEVMLRDSALATKAQLERNELQKRIDKYRKLTISIRNEFDLWSDDSEFAGIIEAQIENLEALLCCDDVARLQ